jgi:hypothetical protein
MMAFDDRPTADVRRPRDDPRSVVLEFSVHDGETTGSVRIAGWASGEVGISLTVNDPELIGSLTLNGREIPRSAYRDAATS